MKKLEQLIRPNIWKLKPYSSARNEFKGEASVFLDANENPFNAPYNRYPDPLQQEVKERIAAIKPVHPASIFLGVGSDEPIDLLYRVFCEPGVDNVVAIDPSYGMYRVCADINNVEYRQVLLTESFELDPQKVMAATDVHTKIIFLCSPNNPTGNSLNPIDMDTILKSFEGIVVIDEAYIDFSSQPSYLSQLDKYKNLVVLQTFSKAWGSAGIRLGMAFADPEIISVFNKIKYPYNINKLTQEHVLSLLEKNERVKGWVEELCAEREMLRSRLSKLKLIKHIYPSDANFLLVRVADACKMYNYMVTQGIIVRNRNNISLCLGCLRITIGTPEENKLLMEALLKADQQL